MNKIFGNQMAYIDTDRIIDALIFSINLHKNQLRKGSQIPYIAHLLGVTSLVMEAGGDTDQAIAALLHDAVEDQGGIKTLKEIQTKFGDRVARIVEECSDSFTYPKPPWRQRKEKYLKHLPSATADARLVSLADKLHNSRSILLDIKNNGLEIFDKFKGGKEGTLWYYKSLAEIFKQIESNCLVDEFVMVVEQIEQIINEDGIS